MKIRRLDLHDERYPVRVKSILDNRAPRHLDVLGNIDLLDKMAVGFGGSRKASQDGLETAWDYAEKVSGRGLVVVSGNARGVDRAAHSAALLCGGSTIFVLPEGINQFEIKDELNAIWDWNRVLVISQFEADGQWEVWRAMARNRLVIALSEAMILIEAGEKGGTFNAGTATLSESVPLFVARNYDESSGNETLIEMGARELTSDLDIVFESTNNLQGATS